MNNLKQGCSDESESAAHRDLAVRICNLRFDPDVPIVAECNTLSIVSPEGYFAQRLDCRTYFAQRERYGHDQSEAVFQGPDDEQFAYCRDLCGRLGILDDQIARADILREYGQAAQIDSQSNQVVEMKPRRELRTFMHVE